MSHNAKLQGQPHPRAHCQEFNPYILEIQVDCKTPAILLEEADLSPKEVNILAIDAEGLDVQILQAFLKLLACRLKSSHCFVLHYGGEKILGELADVHRTLNQARSLQSSWCFSRF